MPRLAKLALQADLCYNGGRNIVVPGGAVNTPGRTHLYRRRIMDIIPSTSGIYKITCTANKRIYIGSAVNLQSRKGQHFSALRQNKHHNPILQNAWNKYGSDAFTFEVLEYVLPMSLTAREQYWFNREKPFGRKGFNVDREAGSRLGNKHTPETIEKLSLSHMGKKQAPETIEKRIAPLRGKKRSPEAIESMRQARLGKKMSPESKKRMSQAKLGNQYQLGKKASPEARAKMSQAAIARKRSPHSPETREKQRQAKLGHEVSSETREKISQVNLGRKHTPEELERKRKASLAMWEKRRNEHA